MQGVTFNKTLHPHIHHYKHSKKYTALCFDKRRKRYLVGNSSRPGLHRTLKKRFFPQYKRSKRRKTTKKKGSTKVIGKRVDNEVAKAVLNDGKILKSQHRYTQALLEYFKCHQHRLEAAQLPTLVPVLGCITQADIITSRINHITQRRELWLWELKTGWAPGLKTARKTNKSSIRMLKKPHSRGKDILLNHYFLQAFYTAKGLEQYAKIKFDHVRVVQVYQEGVYKNRKFQVKASELPYWLKMKD